MALQQVKSYVTVRYAEHITRFKGVSNEQIVKSYSFNYELLKIANKLIEKIANASGTTAIIGKRGVGKTHMLSLVRSLVNQPQMASIIADFEARAALQKHALLKVPESGIASLTLGFDLERGLDFIKVYPSGSIQTTSLRGWVSPEQVRDLIKIGREKFQDYVLFVDGLSPALKHPEKSEYAHYWIDSLAQAANYGEFGLILTVDEDMFEADRMLQELCQAEKIDISNLSLVVEQKLFRKTQEQVRGLVDLYDEIRKSMPHFSSDLEEFIKLYPAHPAILRVSPAMHRYVKGFSLLGFLTEKSSEALVRKDTSLINLDDLFENTETELRKHPYLKEAFGVYDNLLYWSAVNLDSQKALYTKLLLRGLLILSLMGRGATLEEIADATMLNDERGSSNFLKQLQVLMKSLMEADSRIGLIDFGIARYVFRYLFEMEELNTEQLNPTNLNQDQMEIIQSSLEGNTRPVGSTKRFSFLDIVHKAADAIDDNDERLYQLLVSTGRKFFKDWPFTFGGDGKFRYRTELNARWCGSLRRGIFKVGGEVEILPSRDGNTPINEYDWQVTVMTPDKRAIPFVENAPNTLLYWQPSEFSKEDGLVLKYLIAMQDEALLEHFEQEEIDRYLAAFETTLVDLFGLTYLEGGKIVNLEGDKSPVNYHSSNFINIILAKIVDIPLSKRYPQHPRFEDLLDPDYIDQIADWMLTSDKNPDPDQQMYLEQFARPLGLVKTDNNTYVLDIVGKEFSPSTPVGSLLELLEKVGDGALTKNQAYSKLRIEPFGLQRPALLVILAALAGAKKITLVDDQNKPIHNDAGLRPDSEISDFSAIYNAKPKMKITSWGETEKKAVVQNTTFANQTVMLVDDEPDILTCIELAVEPLGCKMKTAENGKEALMQLLEDNKVDLVISDLMMPGMDGVQLFYEMQTNPQLRDIPFIVLSSLDNDEDIAKALESGVTDYWTKPFSIVELTAKIRKFLRRRLATTDAYSITAWPNEKSPESASFRVPEFRTGESKALPTPQSTPTLSQKSRPTGAVDVAILEAGIEFDSQKLYDQYADIYLRTGNMPEIPEYEDFEAELLVKLNKLKKQFRCNNFMLYVEVKNNKSNVYCQLMRSTEYLAKEPKFLLL